jgi:hypothetical protein
MCTRAVALLIGAAALAGCGRAATPQTAAHAAGRPPARLTITYRPHGTYPRPGQAQAARRWTLTCFPPGGSHPARAAACQELADHGGDLFAPGAQCLVIVQGAPSATVDGVLGGRTVRFATSTCAPAWRTLRSLLTGR